MKKHILTRILGAVAFTIMIVATVLSQGRTNITGTAIIYGNGLNTRVATRTFTLHLNGVTSDADTDRYLQILRSGGQDDLLKAIRTEDLGRFSLGGNVGQAVNAVRIDDFGGMRRIRLVFARWLGFGELRYGYRSVDYPFSYVELLIDPESGKGEGTFFPAARIRFKGKGNGPDVVEIEDFGTFPAKLMGVRVNGGRLP